MDKIDHFEISLKGLKRGLYSYDFEIGPSFFDPFKERVNEKGNFKIHINLEKQSELISVDIRIDGQLMTFCDRCLADIKLPLASKDRLIFKYESDEAFDDEHVVILDPLEGKLDLSPHILEQILFSIPMIRTYDCESENPKPCDTKVLERLDKVEEQIIEDNPFKDLLKDFREK